MLKTKRTKGGSDMHEPHLTRDNTEKNMTEEEEAKEKKDKLQMGKINNFSIKNTLIAKFLVLKFIDDKEFRENVKNDNEFLNFLKTEKKRNFPSFHFNMSPKIVNEEFDDYIKHKLKNEQYKIEKDELYNFKEVINIITKYEEHKSNLDNFSTGSTKSTTIEDYIDNYLNFHDMYMNNVLPKYKINKSEESAETSEPAASEQKPVETSEPAAAKTPETGGRRKTRRNKKKVDRKTRKATKKGKKSSKRKTLRKKTRK